MSSKTVVTCDVCDAEKKDVNHWFTIWISREAYENKVASTLTTIHGISHSVKGMQHVCGVAHALVLHNRFLESGTLEMDLKHPQELQYPSFVEITV